MAIKIIKKEYNQAKRNKIYKEQLNLLSSMIDPAMDENKRKTLQGLIEEAAFLRASLIELKDSIRANGYIEEYRNGATQTGHKDSCYVKAYSILLKSYMASVKLLASFDFNISAGADEFDKFLKG